MIRPLLMIALTLIPAAPLRVELQAQGAVPESQVRIIGQIAVKPEREREFLALIARMTERSRKEDGNLRYELFRSAPLGGQPGPDPTFVFVEEWRTQAAFAAHGAWAGQIVRTDWPELTRSVSMLRLTPAVLGGGN